MDTKGGRFSLEINGRTFTGRGAAKINPSTVAIENGANQNGSGYSMVKPRLATLDLSFDRGRSDRVKWDAAMLLERVNVTFVETDLNPSVTHLFTNGRWAGDGAEIDSATGEVTGLKIETDSYQAV